MMAIEEAFRCAGLLHLHRRVLGSSPDSFPVKEALRKLIGALERMRLGASTEVCALFPLFTAGCESRDSTQRGKLLNRFFVLEKSGLKQVSLFCCSFQSSANCLTDSKCSSTDATLLGRQTSLDCACRG
jgi:hypothetical protein